MPVGQVVTECPQVNVCTPGVDILLVIVEACEAETGARLEILHSALKQYMHRHFLAEAQAADVVTTPEQSAHAASYLDIEREFADLTSVDLAHTWVDI